MTKKNNVTDEQCLKIRRQADDLVRRVEQGSLSFDMVRGPLQGLIEGFSLEVVNAWTEKDGIIYFSVTSDGTTGPEWIKRLTSKGFRISDYAKGLLNSKEFKPTNGTTTKIAVIKGGLFSDSERITKNIRNYAIKHNFTVPNPEIACLIREQFSGKDLKAMGFYWIVAMHEPIQNSDGVPLLLNAFRDGGGSWLCTAWGNPGSRWHRCNGFAFACSQG